MKKWIFGTKYEKVGLTISNNRKIKTKLLITIPIFISATLFGTPDQKDKNTRASSLIRAEILKIFDIDGDGKLCMTERFARERKCNKYSIFFISKAILFRID